MSMETSYARMIFVAVVIALTVLFAIVAVSKADRIPTSQAETIWYNNFNWKCGAGSLVCGTRKASLQCFPTPGAPHRNSCRYEFTHHPVGGTNRWCVVWGDLLHTAVYFWREDC